MLSLIIVLLNKALNTLIFLKKGADIVSLIFGEKYYSDKQLYSHFKRIHEKTNCFLLLHQQILENGVSSDPIFVYYSINILEKISKLKNS